MKPVGLKRAKINIVKSYASNPTFKRHVINQLESHLALMTPELRQNDPNSWQRYRNQVQALRLRLREAANMIYEVDVTVLKYNKTVRVEVEAERDWKFHDVVKNAIDNAIRRVRNEYFPTHANTDRPMIKFAKFFVNMSKKDRKGGRVFEAPGEILRIYVEKHIQDLYADKKPIDNTKYIGIELEFCAPIKKNLFALKLFQTGIYKFAQLKEDGSLRPQEGETAFELAILLEESNYKKDFKKITNLLTEIKAVAKERRCGLHVHLDMRRRNKELVYNNLVAAQYALLSVVDPRRYNNEFCRVVDSRKFPTSFTGERHERYKTINAAAYYKYKTLEIRMHEGSVDYNQIVNWIDMLIRIAGHKKKLVSNITTINSLAKKVKLKKKNYLFNLERACSWQIQGQHIPEVRIMREDSTRGQGIAVPRPRTTSDLLREMRGDAPSPERSNPIPRPSVPEEQPSTDARETGYRARAREIQRTLREEPSGINSGQAMSLSAMLNAEVPVTSSGRWAITTSPLFESETLTNNGETDSVEEAEEL